MWKLLRRVFFLMDAERAHVMTMQIMAAGVRLPGMALLFKHWFCLEDDRLKTDVCGLVARNPVGLAAGFDKDGRWLDVLACLGFGHVELGTVTPRPQPGNSKPRLFRLPLDRSIINRMGFNNEGAEALARRLRHFERPAGFVVGINIGKNKDTPEDRAVDDYLSCFHTLAPHADYMAINVSSPNTPGLRKLQEREPLNRLLGSLSDANRKLSKPLPLFLKIAPDLDPSALCDVVEVVRQNGFSGIIACNTTIGRPSGLREQSTAVETGGLSGQAIQALAQSRLSYLHSIGGDLRLIGVGGIATAEDAHLRMAAGARWVQLYTGLIFEGPMIVRRINAGLLKKGFNGGSASTITNVS
ncbi:MAG: quinone-dependent dihydroorotate dehydrogenase [Saprospiraceae bacterium]|nr:quinone-dependent dihydroorotate dehydrogenase [Saprospiraceae bacterium]